jgi:hypothetical protein
MNCEELWPNCTAMPAAMRTLDQLQFAVLVIIVLWNWVITIDVIFVIVAIARSQVVTAFSSATTAVAGPWTVGCL